MVWAWVVPVKAHATTRLTRVCQCAIAPPPKGACSALRAHARREDTAVGQERQPGLRQTEIKSWDGFRRFLLALAFPRPVIRFDPQRAGRFGTHPGLRLAVPSARRSHPQPSEPAFPLGWRDA